MTTLALIGKGRWGSKYLEVVKHIKDCQIKYVKTRDYKDLLKAKDIDGIIIATPVDTHAEIIKAFPDKYLLVEKPLTTSYNDAYKITNKKIMIGHTYLYDNAYQKFRNKVKAMQPKVKYFSFEIINPESYGSKSTPLWELAPHMIAMVIDLFGGISEVDTYTVGKEQNAYALIRCKKVEGCVSFGWISNTRVRNFKVTNTEVDIQLDTSLTKNPTALENELQAFIDFIKTGKTRSGLGFGKEVVKVLEAIEDSMKQEKKITL